MNIQFEYNQCLANAENLNSYFKRDSYKKVCNHLWDKINACKAKCEWRENDKQRDIISKCLYSLSTVKTDKELEQCIKNNSGGINSESTVNVCKTKCELYTLANLRDMQL